MKTRLPTLALCLVLVSPGFAAEKKGRKHSSGSTLPPTSPLLQISSAPDNVIQVRDTNGLINTQLGGRDLEFFRTLIETGQLQVLLGDLVKSKAQSEQVKTVAGALVSSQPEENRQIIHLADLNGVVPSPDAAGGPRKTTAELEKLSAASFDKACVDRIVLAIQETVRAYEAGADSSTPEIKSFAQQMLPISKERLGIAEKMLVAGVKTPVATPAFHTSPVLEKGAKANGLTPIPIGTPSPSAFTPPVTTPAPLTLGPVESPAPLLPAPASQRLTLAPPPGTPAAPATPPPVPSKPAPLKP